MEIKTQLESLLNKKMDRQDFIKSSAIGLVALTGLGTVLRMMQPTKQTNEQSADGYGGSAYGGDSTTKKTS